VNKKELPLTETHEARYASGELYYRQACTLSSDGTHWIRHGPYTAYHRNGAVMSEGQFDNGLEQGLWQDFHPNGQRAAEGRFEHGAKAGLWRYWNEAGREEAPHHWSALPSGG
jgi:antitoxin component YwqK of YwqJK toxin-antitoxin module